MTRRRFGTVASAALVLTAVATSSQGDILCRNKKGMLASRTACKRRETQIDPAALGLIGPKGDAGPGARWVLVEADGTIAAQSGGITVTKTQSGTYYVGFGESLTSKTLAATIACTKTSCSFSGAPLANVCGTQAGGGDCAAQFDNPTYVAVFTQNTTQTDEEDRPFYLAAF